MHWLIRKDQAPAFKHRYFVMITYFLFHYYLFMYLCFTPPGKKEKSRD